MDPAEPGGLLAGRYRLGEIIGRGGMGVVWRARDELLNRDVAVKQVIWPSHFTEAEQQAACRRAVREAQMAARLNHRNVIRIFDIVEEAGHPWLVMELLPYRSLRDLVLEDGPLSTAQATKIGLGILAALRAAHAQGILHRDVKPANILLGSDDRVVLTDFGIARGADTPTLTTTGVLIGSPSYIAPERARGGQSDQSGDLWGLGASLYTAVEGRPPFDRENALASLTAVVADDPEPAVNAGPLRPLISGLLRKDPGERLDADQAERMLRRIERSCASGTAWASAPAPAREMARSAPAGEMAGAASAGETAPAGETAGLAGMLRHAPAAPVPVPVPPGSLGPPALEPRRSRRRLVAVLAGVVALALVGTGAVALALSGAPRHQASAQSPTAHPGTHPAAPVSKSPSARPTPSGASGSASASEPASTPPASANAGYGALPPGYHRFTNSTGFSIGVPSGWQISHVGHYVYIRDPANGGVFLLIDQSTHPRPDPLADWQQQEAARRSSFPGYHLIRLQSVDYPQAEKAADWEFTYDRNGVLVHILNRNVLANAHHAYALYWSAPDSQWSAYYHYFQAFAATFRPAPP